MYIFLYDIVYQQQHKSRDLNTCLSDKSQKEAEGTIFRVWHDSALSGLEPKTSRTQSKYSTTTLQIIYIQKI